MSGISSRDLALDGLEVLDGRGAPQVEEVLPNAAAASPRTLAADEMSEPVLDADALAQASASMGVCEVLAEPVL